MRTQYIYFFQIESGPVKIGTAFNVEERLKIAKTFSHEHVSIIGKFPGNNKIELTLHSILDGCRIRGEWFKGTEEVLSISKGIFDIGHEGDGSYIYPVLWREYLDSPTDICPFCFDRHFHGAIDGHRYVHCLKRYGFSTIRSKSGHCFNIENGYIIRSRNQKESGAPILKTRQVNRKRAEQYEELLMIAFNAGKNAKIFNSKGKFPSRDSSRHVTWNHRNVYLCKALFSNLGYNEIGISALLGLKTPNRNPVSFPDYRDNKHCDAWVYGIYNFKKNKLIYDNDSGYLEMYLSRYSEILMQEC